MFRLFSFRFRFRFSSFSFVTVEILFYPVKSLDKKKINRRRKFISCKFLYLFKIFHKTAKLTICRFNSAVLFDLFEAQEKEFFLFVRLKNE